MRARHPVVRVQRQAPYQRAVVLTVEPKIVREDEPLAWLNWAGHLVADVFSDEYKDLDGSHRSVSNRPATSRGDWLQQETPARSRS